MSQLGYTGKSNQAGSPGSEGSNRSDQFALVKWGGQVHVGWVRHGSHLERLTCSNGSNRLDCSNGSDHFKDKSNGAGMSNTGQMGPQPRLV